MDQVHIGYTIWQDPQKNIMPKVTRLDLPKLGQMGVAVEGSTASWPVSTEELPLPAMDSYNQKRRYIDIFNRGQAPFYFSASLNQSWIKLSKSSGVVAKEERIWVTVDWNRAPAGSQKGLIRIAGAGETAFVQVPILHAPGQEPYSMQNIRFIDSGGYISIEPEHFSQNNPAKEARWVKIEGYGRTQSAMSIQPVTAPSATPPDSSPYLEYELYLFTAGKIAVNSTFAPTLNFVPGRGLRYAVSFDDETPQIIEILSKDFDARNGNREWEESVRNASRTIRSTHQIPSVGYHKLKIWMIDPAVVLQKIVIDAGGLKPSYLGPPESEWEFKKSQHIRSIRADLSVGY
jgi:hypothetical protein